MEIRIREATSADEPVIAGFNLRLAQESEGLVLDEGCARAGVAALLQDRTKGIYYLAEAGGAVVGQTMITYEWSDWRNGNIWWIQSVYVKPEFRRAGVFRALYNHLHDLAEAQEDVCSLRLYVHAENTRACESYERLGMTRTRYEIFEQDVRKVGLALLVCLAVFFSQVQAAAPAQDAVQACLAKEGPSLLELYQHLHAHPELSFQEKETSARVAEELRQAGCEVTTGVGKGGVVGVLRNGAGPTVLLRADMDALPVKEQTGLPYASTVVAKDPQGKDVPVMHACGHDIHMTWLVGAARVLGQIKDQWRGTVVFIGQPAEEAVGGATGMIEDGLYQRFPRPDYCFALHDNAELVVGTVGYRPGYGNANIDSVDILVRGVGGHGAYPHKTKDPVVLAAQIVLALQTIVSREVQPGEPIVVTVGTIHGGTRRNIIPDEVRLQLTVRSYSDEARRQTLEAIERIARGQALAAGLPEDRLPEVKVMDEGTPALYNDPALTERLVGALKGWFGETNLIERRASMGGEDFAEFGRTEPKVPICMMTIGGVSPEAYSESQRTGKPLPSLHSPFWAPVPEPSIKAGVTTMTAVVLELTRKNP